MKRCEDMEKIGSILLSYEAIALYELLAIGALIFVIVIQLKKRKRNSQMLQKEAEQKKKQQLDHALGNNWRR